MRVLFRLLPAAIMACAMGTAGVSAQEAGADKLSGRWVFTQNDGRGGAGCLMTLSTEQTDAGAMSAAIENPSSCFDVTEGVTGWLVEGDTLTLYRADGSTAIALENSHNLDAVIYQDSTYYMEKLGDGQ